MSHLGWMSVLLEGAPPDSLPDARTAGHWQILVWGSDLWGPPAFLQGAPGTSPAHTQAHGQSPRSPRAFS